MNYLFLIQYHWTRPEQIAQLSRKIGTTVGKLSETINSSVSISPIFSAVLHISIQFDFTDYIRRAYLLGDVVLDDSDPVTLDNLQYLRNVSLIINQYPSRTIQNYVIWRFMMQQADYMSRQLREIKKRFDKMLQGNIAEELQKSTCATFVSNVMGFAVSKLYIKKYFDENARNQVCRISSDLFISLFSSSKVIGND